MQDNLTPDWMPFDTAPKDGSLIVILFWDRQEDDHEDWRDPKGHWQVGYGRYDKAFESWSVNYLVAKPWYWLPLPPLPTVETPDLTGIEDDNAARMKTPNEALKALYRRGKSLTSTGRNCPKEK